MTDDTWTHPTMTREQFQARLEELAIENAIAEAEFVASGAEVPYFWLSFVDEDAVPGTAFLGACFVQAATGVGAVDRAHELGINPGGQVAMAGPVRAEDMSAAYREKWCERLLDKEEATNLPEPDLAV